MPDLRVSLLLFALLPIPFAQAQGKKVIHAFVALCDNEHQGIAPVPAKIGNGDDPVNNLYWGNSEGVAGIFGASKAWKKQGKAADPDGSGPVLERLVFRHETTGSLLVADAYRGREIKQCMTDYFASLAGTFVSAVETSAGKVAIGGQADFISFTGHNGLMEFTVPIPEKVPGTPAKTTVAFCCQSRSYFSEPLASLNATPLILTKQNMYPGSFLLRDVVEGWLAGKKGPACLDLAASAYARNQKISQKAALGVFFTPEPTKIQP